MTKPDDILNFWIGEDRTRVPAEIRRRWWVKDPALDDEIRRRFAEDLERAVRGELDGWAAEPSSCVALVILLDQFTRNLFRGSPRSWAHDLKAQQIVCDALDRGVDAHLEAAERMFLYMPLMHAEDLELQHRCVSKFEKMCEALPEDVVGDYATNVDYAKQHRDIVARFGRFPHRNAVIGRECTPEEETFLEQPGSSF